MNPIPEEMSHSNDLVESVGQGEPMGAVWEKQRAEALNKPLERGMIVPVYLDPDLCTRFEGMGVLVEKLTPYPVAGLEKWQIRMNGKEVGRWFKTKGA